MGIRLEITNKNTDPVTIKVYRDIVPLDRANLPAAVGQIDNATGNPVVYNDNEVIQGNTYYYVFETIGDKDRAYSRNHKIQALETRGPGDNDLKVGNRNLGYYGNLTAGSLIESATLCTTIGLTGHTVQPINYWYKFARKGKVLFVPSNFIAKGGMSYTKLKNLGLDVGKTITLNGNQYKVRLMTGWDENNSMDGSLVPGTVYSMEDYPAAVNEFNDLLYPLTKWTPNGQKLPGLYQQTVNQLTGGLLVVCADSDGQKFVRRGAAAEARSGVTSFVYDNTLGTANASFVLYPVLELIEG